MFGLQETLHMRSSAMKNLKEEPIISHHHHQLQGSVRNWMQPTLVEQAAAGYNYTYRPIHSHAGFVVKKM